jgi:hypothetical protein
VNTPSLTNDPIIAQRAELDCGRPQEAFSNFPARFFQHTPATLPIRVEEPVRLASGSWKVLIYRKRKILLVADADLMLKKNIIG